ncbi:MAG: hypothetical protein RL754_925 [Bacteroidota bacterium]|jgi:hypothetical protein
MKHLLFTAIFLFAAPIVHAQETGSEQFSGKKITRKAIYSVSGAFTDLNNWNAGGENSSNMAVLARENWKVVTENWTTVHLAEANYGLSRQAGLLTKNADRLEWTTTITGNPNGSDWKVSGQANLRTQMAAGFAAGDTSRTPISNFGAPLYGQFSFGIGNNAYEHWQLFISPVAAKTTTVLDSALSNKGAFGVDPGTVFRFEGGAKFTANYQRDFTDQFSLTGKSDIFLNYATPLNTVDIAVELIAMYKIKEFLTLNGHVQFVRDIDVIDLWQRRSVMGIGLAWQIQ